MTDIAVHGTNGVSFDLTIPVLIIGAGGAGLCAALAARQVGPEVLVLERDATPLGTTAMSTGLIPAAGTAQQRAAGVVDTPELMAKDILAKAKHQTDAEAVQALAAASAETIAWLGRTVDVPLSLVEGFLYPGMSALRMHGTPNRTGAELMAALAEAASRDGVDVLTEATVTSLYADPDGTVRGVAYTRPDGQEERVGCAALVLACCGFGGNAEMVARFMPEIAAGTFHGHPGNKGDALRWGEALGAGTSDLGAYQGHGGLAAGYGIPILWPVIMQGGVQVNRDGIRFANEASGYSEHAVEVLKQPGGVAWDIYDARIHAAMAEFDDYRDAMQAGAIRVAPDLAGLAEATGLPLASLAATLAEVAALTRGQGTDRFGRDFAAAGLPPLAPPYHAVRVTGALFHTQGGLTVDDEARVTRPDGTRLPNLYAAGGAARGVSGPSCWGYLAGNGLLTATSYGRLAGESAARLAQS